MHNLMQPISEGIVNALFNLAPFKRTTERPKVTPMPNGAETIELTFDRGVEIKIVAVAQVEIKKAYVISAARDKAAGGNFKLQTEKRLVPLDLFLGWGLMSSPFSSRMFSYTKTYDNEGGRVMTYESDQYKVDRAWGNCAHVHMMTPLDIQIPKAGDCVAIRGYLVDVYIDGVCTWPTDINIGDENCETIYPSHFKVLRN